jgi:hypothetical protein
MQVFRSEVEFARLLTEVKSYSPELGHLGLHQLEVTERRFVRLQQCLVAWLHRQPSGLYR